MGGLDRLKAKMAADRKAGRLVSVMAGVLVAVLAYAALQTSNAATPLVAMEAESGTPAGKAAAGTAAGASGGSAVSFGTDGGGNLLFEDDFDGAAGSLPDQSKWGDWSACSYRPSAAYGLIQCGDNEKLDGSGHLVIPATPTAGSALTTGDRFKFVYGTMSAWVKLPPQPGYWPAFWSLNGPFSGPDILPGGEVDVLEGYTTWKNVYHAVGHNWGGTDETNTGSPDNYCPNDYQARNIDLTTAYHKYTAKVEPGKISYFFDDEPCGQAFTKDTNPGKPWGFGPDVSRGNWLILTLAVGGADGQQIPASQPAQLLVDRVEVRAP